MAFAAWIPAIASIAGSLISAAGQKNTNETNLEIQQQNSAFNAEQAALNRDFSATQAQKQMDFQQYNADTIWQRGTRDMMAAGLNPMLAYSQGGNPSPSGAMAVGSQASAGMPGNQQNVFASAGATASQWATIENIAADTEKKKEEAELTKTQRLGYTGEQDVRVDKMRKEADLTVQQADLTNAQTVKVKAEVERVLEETKNLSADTALKRVNEVLQKYDIPRMRAEAHYFETPVGRESPHNKYGPQTPFRLLEGLGERIINRWSAK